MKHSNIFIVLLSVFLILPPCLVSAEDSFSNVYIFGDSLSDTGNLAALPDFDFLNQPPYDRGFSNGPRAVEVLAKLLGLSANPSLHLAGLNAGTNYAVAGATARGDEVIDLRSQINAFLLEAGPTVPADALYVVIIGGNDIRDARDERSIHKVIRILRRAVYGIDEAVRSLVSSGARSILIVNSPNLGAVPETAALAQQTGAKNLVRRARLISQYFNRRLSKKVAKIERDFHIDLVDFDLFSFFQSIIRNRTALGFSNSSDGCFSGVSFTFNLHCDNGVNFDRFVFFDEIHTSARTNERIGQAFFALVPAPTPAYDLITNKH